MGTAVAVPLEEYLTTSYEHDREWIDGELRERAMPDDDHSALQAFFIGYFLGLRLQLDIKVRPELRVKVAAGRYRLPDVTLLPGSAPRQPIPDAAPVLCIEILSSEDRASELAEKIADYVAMGVGAIWIVDPRRRTLATADAAGIHMVKEVALPGMMGKLTDREIFAELDQNNASAR